MRTELKVTAESVDYNFGILPTNDGGKSFNIATEPWQKGSVLWRIPLHDWAGGLGRDRLKGESTYSKANADVSRGILVPPPKLTTFETPVTDYSYEVFYGGYAYGTVPYQGGGRILPDFIASTRLGSKEYFLGGRYVYSFDATYNLTLEKDLGEGNEGADIVTFQIGRAHV